MNLEMPAQPLTTYQVPGYQVKVYTYLHKRRYSCLIWFLSQDYLEVFKLLITVSGIGPKVALGVLSVHTPDGLRFAILSEDVKIITKAPGIGLRQPKNNIRAEGQV